MLDSKRVFYEIALLDNDLLINEQICFFKILNPMKAWFDAASSNV